MAAEKNTKDLFIPLYSLLAALEGMGAVLLLFSQRSMERNAWLLGYSKERILLGGAALVGVFVLGVLAFLTYRSAAWRQRIVTFLDRHLGNSSLFQAFGTLLAWLFLMIIGIVILFNTPFARNLGPLGAIYNRAAALLGWAALLIIQTGIFAWMRYREHFSEIRLHPVLIGKTLLALLLATLAIAHIIILVFRLDLLISIPGWFWQFHEKETGPRDLILPVLFFAPIAAAIWLYRHPRRGKTGLLLLIALGLFLQYGFGLADEFGVDTVRRKYSESGHQVYVQHACDDPGLIRAITSYESLYGDLRYVSTKTPGVLSVYILTQKLANFLHPQRSHAACMEETTRFMLWVYPLLSFSVLALLYWLNRELLDGEDGLLPGLFYLSCSNVILIPLFLDQAVYPPVFLLGAALMVITVRKQSFKWALFSGAAAYAMMFLSFTFLTILPFAAVLFTFDYWVHRKQRSFTDLIKLGAGLLLGALALYAVLRVGLNFDILTRYENMMVVHRYDDFFARYPEMTITPEILERGFRPTLSDTLYGVWLNNISTAAWMGFPLYLLFLIGAVSVFPPILRGNATPRQVLLAAFTAMFVALNLFGQTAGEVARLWIFMAPMMCMLAVPLVKTLFKRENTAVLFVLVLQMSVMIATFKFQDFFS